MEIRWVALVVLVAEPTSVTRVPTVVVTELGVNPAMIGPPAAVADCWPATTAPASPSTPASAAGTTRRRRSALFMIFLPLRRRHERAGGRPDSTSAVSVSDGFLPDYQ